MASIIAITSLKIEGDIKEQVIDELGNAVTTWMGKDPSLRSIMWLPLPDENFSIHERAILNLFVFIPPKTIDLKREMLQNIQKAVDRFFSRTEVNTIVIFKEHADENVGKDGVLRWDVTNKK